MAKYLQLDLTGRTKGKPPKWLPNFLKPIFTWDTTKTIHSKIPLDPIDLKHEVDILGGYIVVDVENGTELLVGAEYAGLSKTLIDVTAPDGSWSVDSGSLGGFSVTGKISIVTA